MGDLHKGIYGTRVVTLSVWVIFTKAYMVLGCNTVSMGDLCIEIGSVLCACFNCKMRLLWTTGSTKNYYL